VNVDRILAGLSGEVVSGVAADGKRRNKDNRDHSGEDAEDGTQRARLPEPAVSSNPDDW
jgi:hypothetical protein